MGRVAPNPTEPNHAMSLWEGDAMDPELVMLLKRMPETEKQTSRILNGWDDVRSLIAGIALSLGLHKEQNAAAEPAPDGDAGND